MNNKIKWRVYGSQSISAHMDELNRKHDVHPCAVLNLAGQLMKKFYESEFIVTYDDSGKITNVEYVPDI